MKLGSIPVYSIRLDYTAHNVDTTTPYQLSASAPVRARALEIFDSSGQTGELLYGPVGSEQKLLDILPGGNGRMPCIVNEGMRLCVRAISATADAGELTINFYY